jgi:hypothetical protein
MDSYVQIKLWRRAPDSRQYCVRQAPIPRAGVTDSSQHTVPRVREGVGLTRLSGELECASDIDRPSIRPTKTLKTRGRRMARTH